MTHRAQQQAAGENGRQIDDNQDDLGRDVNDPDNRIGDRATADKAAADKAHAMARKIALERPYRHDKDAEDSNVTGGFNQKSKP